MAREQIAAAIEGAFNSSSLCTSNLEAANVVDAMASIATQLKFIGLGEGTAKGAIEVLSIEVHQAGAMVADALRDSLIAESHGYGREINLVTAMKDVALQLKYLGNGDAATTMGAIENLAKEVMEGTTRMAEGLDAIAGAIHGLASAIESHGR